MESPTKAIRIGSFLLCVCLHAEDNDARSDDGQKKASLREFSFTFPVLIFVSELEDKDEVDEAEEDDDENKYEVELRIRVAMKEMMRMKRMP